MTRTITASLFGAGFLLAISARPVPAETVLHVLTGNIQEERFGFAVAGGGDANGDGFADLAVGAPAALGVGTVRMHSGLDGSLLLLLTGDSAGDEFGSAVSFVGDVDLDGYDDLIVGSPKDDNTGSDSGSAKVFSGFDGALLYTFDGDSPIDNLGFSVGGGGDLDGDGIPDLIAGFPNSNANGTLSGGARAWSGADGSPLYTWYGSGPGDNLGMSVAVAGDVNADGFDDVIVGAWEATGGGGGNGYAEVFSGVNGALLLHLVGPLYGSRFGQSVGAAGDVNADGHDDLIVGAPEDDSADDQAGSAGVFSGLGGTLLFAWQGSGDDDFFGHAVAGVGDVDGDGHSDLLVGAPGESLSLGEEHEGVVHLYAGSDGAELASFVGDPFDNFGLSLAAAGDVDGDGYPDLFMGTPFADPNGPNSGVARVDSGFDCTDYANYCQTLPNSVGPGALIHVGGVPSVSQNDFSLIATGLPLTQPGIFYYGLNQGMVPFGNGFRCLAGQVYRLPVVHAQGGVLTYTLDFTHPPSPAATITPGSAWNFQCWYRDPAPSEAPHFFNLSDALHIVFCR